MKLKQIFPLQSKFAVKPPPLYLGLQASLYFSATPCVLPFSNPK